MISGQLRTFKKCYPTQKWQIFRHYEPDIHFFASICNDAQTEGIAQLVWDYDNVEVERLNDPTDLSIPSVESGSFAPYANATTHTKLMLQHWGNKKVWDFFCSKSDLSSFDLVIRIRPDLWIHRFQSPFYAGSHMIGKLAFLPWWGKFGGVNDRLAIMTPSAAESYFGTYDAIPELLSRGCPFHPETLVYENLRRNGVGVSSTLMIEFSTMRMDGSQRWAEIAMSDLAELIATKT